MDGKVKIVIEVDGKQVSIASDELDKLGKSGHESGKGISEVEKGMGKAGVSAKQLAISLGLVKIASTALNVLKKSLDGAISRFDTLNTFPKIMNSVGVSSQEAEAAINKLANGLEGTTGYLDQITANAQRMFFALGDLDKSADLALSLQRAFDASGASADQAKRGTEQYIQALQKGKFDMEEWKTLQETMGVGLNELAKEFGFTGASAQRDLYQALQDGKIPMDEFHNKLIEIGGATGTLGEMAKTNSSTLRNEIDFLANTAAKGMANILESVNNLVKEVTGKDIASHLQSLRFVVDASFNAIGKVIESTAPVIKVFAAGIKGLIPIVDTLTPAILGLVAAYAAYTVITKASAAIQASNAALKIATTSGKALVVVTQAKMAAQVASTTATKADVVATAAQTGAVKLSTLAIGLMTGTINLSTIAMLAKAAAIKAYVAVLTLTAMPIAAVVAGIGLLTAATIAIVRYFKQASEEANRLNSENEALGESTNALNESINSSSQAHEENQVSIRASSDANAELASKIEELSEKENKSAAEKQLLNSYIEQLNGSVEGLNLAYNEEANALSISSEEMQARIELMKEQETANASMERLTEILEEQSEVEQKLADTNELREEWNQKLEEGSVKAGEHKDAIAELDEQEQLLKVTTAELAEQQKITEEQMTASMEAITEATEAGVGNQIIAFDDLSESQQATVESMKSTWEDYKSAATDMFDTISDKIEITASEMASNLEENQRVISEWSENIATLAERGVDEGLLETLRNAGPESAGHVNALVNASDEELAHLSEVFAQGGDVATDALSKSLGIEESGVMDAVGHLVSDTESSLKSAIESAGFDQLGIDITDGFAGGVEKGTPDAEKASENLATKTIEAAEKTLEVQSPSKVFEKIGTSTTDGLVVGIDNGTPKVIDTMKKLALEMVNPFKTIDTQFRLIGLDAMNGFIDGLNSRRGTVISTARNIANQAANTMRQALQIQSPSRVTAKIGEDTGQGLADGIENKQKVVNEASIKMAKSVADIMEVNIKSMNAAIKSATENHNLEIAQLEKRHKEDVQSIRIKASEDKRALTRDEKIRIERMTEDHKQKILDMEEKAAEERVKIAEDSAKRLIEIGERYVAERKWQGEMSIKDEGHFWYQMFSQLERGTEEYENALKKHQDVVKRFRSEMEKTNEDYAKRMADIDRNLANETKKLKDDYAKTSENIRKKLEDDINKLNEKYQNAYNSRVSELTNITGLFERYYKKSRVPEGHLIRSLESQVQALEEYSDVMGSLDERIDNKDLIAELQALGPDSLAELEALNRMSDDQLSEYVSLYEERFRLASKQAGKELEPMKRETQRQVQELNRIAANELNILQIQTQAQLKELNEIAQSELEVLENEWVQKINDIVLGTEEEFDQMYYVGQDAIQGLEDGMLAMEPSLMKTAKRIADSVSRTIKSALDIKSPSRLMRDEVGKMIPAGIALGIKEYGHLIDKEMLGLSNRLMTATPEQALGVSRMRYSGAGSVMNSSTISNDNSRSYKPTIKNYFTPAESTPSESSRKQIQEQKRLAMEWGL